MIRNLIFCIIILCGSIYCKANTLYDSIGMVKIKGLNYVKFKIATGNGLYGIAKRYNCTTDEIKKANKEDLTILSVGQVILVPYKGNVNSTPDKKIKPIRTKDKPKANPIEGPKTKVVYHTVLKGETFFSIAKKYGIQVKDIKKWNKIEDNSLKLGSKLIVINPQKQKKATNKTITTKYGDKISPEVVKNTDEIDEKGKKKGTKILTESGIATYIDDGSIITKKNMALHISAPRGTIITLTNPMNNKQVFVNVVGKFNPVGEDANLKLKITKAAADKLGVLDRYFKVIITYTVESGK